MSKKLVVIVDEEARRTLQNVGFRWFHQAEERKDRDISIIVPSGDEVTVRGALLDQPQLGLHASEYLYIEITRCCQLACQDCGASDLVRTDNSRNKVPYIIDDFAIKLAQETAKNPFERARYLYYSGGEPLIDADQFRHIHGLFKGLQNTIFVVTTNGLTFPLNKSSLEDFVSSLGIDYVAISYSNGHQTQYEEFAKAGNMKGFVPDNVDPRFALAEKIKQIAPYFPKEVGFFVNAVIRDSNEGTINELKQYLEGSGITIFPTKLYGARQPCSQGEELSIRYNGDLYPHCYDVFNRTNKLGMIGLLMD